MTDRHGRRRTSPLPVAGAAIGTFVALLAVLIVQVRSGSDPVLKPSVRAQPPRIVLHRRIIDTRVIVTTDPPAVANARAASPAAAPAALAPSQPAPRVTYAPVQAAPAPAPPPAPVTRTS